MKSSFKITFIYFLISFFWILFSDKFLQAFSTDTTTITRMQTYKGWFFIISTSLFLFWLIYTEFKKKSKIQEELRKAMKKAEESDRLKTAFLSNMSHEIRTPLNGIVGFGHLLCEGQTTEGEKEVYRDQINRNSQLLLKIIDDIIEISRIQENMITVNIQPVDLHQLLSRLHSTYRNTEPAISAKNLQFNILNDNRQNPLIIQTDPARLSQILINLIDNAIKYTDQGSVNIGYQINGMNIHIFVEDTGIGIAPEHQKLVFERYKQPALTREVNAGFGLGLSISQGLANALHGEIEIQSEKGKGSRFTIRLPYYPN
ncbi:MAG: sensor histidine kinase [Mangrovibacterium sp.]